MKNITALNAYLKPFEPFFKMEGVSEICINRPYELWIEQFGVFTSYNILELSMNYLRQLASLVGEYSNREISPEHPTLSSVLPDGSRVQFVMEPACEKNSFICAIRRKSIMNLSLEHYFDEGKENIIKQSSSKKYLSHDDQQLLHEYHQKNYLEFLKLSVINKKNILISGGTSTGKTTFLNSLLKFIPQEERIITIETDREVFSDHKNVVHLLAAEEGKSVANINMLGLLKTSLRLRPDRILVSELRAEEAFPYLRAINSGHPGSITTLHADSPTSCFDQLAFMAMQSGTSLTKQELQDYAKSIINIVVQIKRDASGKRFISEIYFDAAEHRTEKYISKKYISEDSGQESVINF